MAGGFAEEGEKAKRLAVSGGACLLAFLNSFTSTSSVGGIYSTFTLIPVLWLVYSGAYMLCIVVMPFEKLPFCVAIT